jgi:hypothetical protein
MSGVLILALHFSIERDPGAKRTAYKVLSVISAVV